MASIELPNGQFYRFYYNSYGELARVEYPTGAATEYDYGRGTNNYTDNNTLQSGLIVFAAGNFSEYQIYRRVYEERIYPTGGTGGSYESKTNWSLLNTDGSVTVENKDSSGGSLGFVKHYFYGNPAISFFDSARNPSGFPDWREGQEYKTENYSANPTVLLRKTEVKNESQEMSWWNAWCQSHQNYCNNNPDYAPHKNPRVSRELSITVENNNALAVLTKKEYDDGGNSDAAYYSALNIKRSKAYNYKLLTLATVQNNNIDSLANLFSESDLASVSETDYLYDAGHKDRYILGLPFETRVMNPASPTQVSAKSQIIFDEQGQYYSMSDPGSTIGYEIPTGAYAHLRGNVTTNKTWFAEENRWIETHTQYDNFGNARKVWDSSGDQSRFVETEYSPDYYYAYPTKTIAKSPDPTGTHGTTENSIVTRGYDFWTGLATSVTDANSQTTIMEYDNLFRPKKITPPAGGIAAEKIYGDTPGNLFVKTRTQVDAQNWNESTAYLDNFGRLYKTQTKDLQGDIFAEVEYDSFGRVKRASNPYRQGEQKYWSKPRYDNAGRVVETFAPAAAGQTGASLGIVEFGISGIPGFIGNYVTATDASGRKARSFTNVYGQTVRADEPTGNNDLGALDNPNQPSYYSYNVKGELVRIKQGNQNQACGTTAQCRYFMYDSLGRMIRVKQPEQTPHASLATTGNPENNQWTSGFTYDVLGNVITVTDAKGMTITNAYDKAGRVTTSIYSDNVTPQVEYFYDGTGLGISPPQFSKGSLTKISNGVSETRYTSFDNYGRVLANQQVTDGQTYNFGYKYDGVGNLTEETYPSGRVVKTLSDSDGGLAAVSSKTANSPFRTYASGFNYSATGNIKAMMLGNGRWETASFNERNQATQLGLGNNATDTSLWKVNYDYGELNADGSVSANKNIGMVAKQTISLQTTTFVQTYKYDSLNRLTEAKENANTVTGTENWKQTFDYDRNGNRTGFYQKVGSSVLPINNLTKPQIDAATNRFTTGQGYVYDLNGNLIQDAENRQFTYDGDDKQTVVRNLNIPTTSQNPDANVIGRYYYDGEGKRVKKETNLETTVFVYDAAGSLAAEYSTQTNQNPATSYLTTDSLGSPRVITDKSGSVVSRRDFMPFGEELLAGVGARDSAAMKYSASGIDNIRRRFTGYEKDIETDLDFAEARMYKNSHGRFTAADPLLASASLADPQTFNRYSYAGNNPVNLTDPSGLKWCRAANNDTTFRPGACNSNESIVQDNSVGEVTGGCFKTSRGGCAGAGSIVNFNSNGTVTVLNPANQQDAARIADFYGATIQATYDPVGTNTGSIVSNAIDTLSDFGLGVAQGVGGSVSPICSACDPQSTDTVPQRLGQTTGNGAITLFSLDSLIGSLFGDGAALVTGQVEALPVTLVLTAVSATVLVNSVRYSSKLSTTPMQMTGMDENVDRTGRGKKTAPVDDADGPHTTIKKDSQTGDVKGTQTWEPNGSGGWKSRKRVDINPQGKPHYNKKTNQYIPTPHTQGNKIKGGVRPARNNELPK